MNIDPAIISSLIALAGIIISAVITKDGLYKELEKKDALMEQKLEQVDEHLREHNTYAKLFQENIPVINEQIKGLKEDIKELKHANKQ